MEHETKRLSMNLSPKQELEHCQWWFRLCAPSRPLSGFCTRSSHHPESWVFHPPVFSKNTLTIYVCVFKQYAAVSFFKIIFELHKNCIALYYPSVTFFCLFNNIKVQAYCTMQLYSPPFQCFIRFRQMTMLYTHSLWMENWVISRSLIF